MFLCHVNIPIQDVIVVGDSNNDLPLFELAGFKVEIGNGSEKLKQLSDWIALTLEEGGLTEAIEMFIKF